MMTAKMTPTARKARTAKITARVAFGTGVAVSLAANVLASKHTPIGIAVGLWTPVAFLVSMALIENVPAKGWAGKARLVAIVFLAAIAGWASYWHLVDVASLGGADALTSHLLPFTVDVMMALAGPAMKAKAAAAPARRRPAAKNVTPITKARKSTATA
jgi:hypothetical protein